MLSVTKAALGAFAAAALVAETAHAAIEARIVHRRGQAGH